MQKQQLILCTNSGIKVYDINIDVIIQELQTDGMAKMFVNPNYSKIDNPVKSTEHFLKYKLSALPNERILDLVMLKTKSSSVNQSQGGTSTCSSSSRSISSNSAAASADNLLLSTNLGQYVLMRSDSYLVQWRFTGYESSKLKHSVLPPRGLIDFYGNESEPQECSKVIAVEQDCLQLIDIKKKEIRKLKMSTGAKSESSSKLETKIVDNGIIVDNTKEWLFKLSLAKSAGQTCCTVVRDCQLRKFDYVLEAFDQIVSDDAP